MIMTQRKLQFFAAPFTPISSDGSIKLELVAAYLKFLTKNGVTGAFLNGSSGEGVSLRISERCLLTQEWLKHANKDFPVIVNVSHSCLEEVRTLVECAEQTGAAGFACTAPFYYRPKNLDELIQYCASVAIMAPDLPFYYYHIPSMTGVNFPMQDFLTQAGKCIPNLSGLKFSHENLVDFQLCRLIEPERFTIYSGHDDFLLSTYATGTDHYIGSCYNYAMPFFTEMIRLFELGEICEANKIQAYMVKIIRALAASGNYFSAAKYVMKLLGIDCGSVLSPMAQNSEGSLLNLQQELIQFEFFERLQDLDQS